MSSSSLANWDGSQTRRNSKQPFGNSDVRTLSFGGPLASTSTETSNNNHTAAYFDASLTRTEDHQASWRTAEGNNQDVSSMTTVGTTISTTMPHLATNVDISMDITKIFEEENVITRQNYPESVYSADAEGEPDDDQEKTVSELLTFSSWSPIQSPKIRRQVQENTIPDVPPAEDSSSPLLTIGSLFTPPPSDQPVLLSPITPFPPRRQRFFFSHVAVPPFPKERTRSDYPQKKRIHPVERHLTLGEALQASLDHNAQVGALHTTQRGGDGGHQVEKKRFRNTQPNAVAGPSSVSASSFRRESMKIDHKRDREETDDDSPRKKPKTYEEERKYRTTEGDLPSRGHTPAGPRAYTKYDEELGSLRLFVDCITPISVAVLTLNTRFALAATHAKENVKEQKNLPKSDAKMIENRHGRKKSWFVWPPSGPGFLDAVREEYFAGGLVKLQDDAAGDEVEGEVLLDHISTKTCRELSSEPILGDELRACRKTRDKEVKRHIRAVEPLYKDIPMPQPKSKPHDFKAALEAESENYKAKPASPPEGHQPCPSNTNVVERKHSALHTDDQEGTPCGLGTNAIPKTSPERREGSPERTVSSPNHPHRRKSNSEVTQLMSPVREDADILLSHRHYFPKPRSRIATSAPLERSETGAEGIVSPDHTKIDRERYEASQQTVSPPGSHHSHKPSSAATIAQETFSKQHEVSHEEMLSPPDHQLSARALGKQRAVTPAGLLFGSGTSLPTPQFTVDHSMPLQNVIQQSSYAPTLSNGLAPMCTNPFAPLVQLEAAPFMPQVPLSDPDDFLGSFIDSPSKTYCVDQSQLGADNAFLPQSMTTLDSIPSSPDFDDPMVSTWYGDSNDSSSLDNLPSVLYFDGTVNPSLLGGTQDVLFTPPESPTLPSPPAHSPSPWDIISLSRRSRSDRPNSPSQSTTSSSSCSSASSRSSSSPPSPMVEPSPSLKRRPSSTASEYVESETTTTVSLRPPRPSRHALRQVPDGMIPTSELNSYLSSDDESESPADRVKRTRKPAAAMKITPPQERELQAENDIDSKSGVANGKSRGRRSEWPRCDEKTFCHQCRTTSDRAKLACPCGKKYCVRCLSIKYEGHFVYDPARTTFTCPSCQKHCSCDICTRKRGEVYVSLRNHPEHSQQSPSHLRSKRVTSKPKRVPELLTTPSTPRPRSSLGGKTNLPPFSMTMPGPETYWATMYALSGEKIARAFVGEDGKDEVVVLRPLKRVFVGAVQPSWGLGPNTILKDLDPVPTVKDMKDGRHRQCYVGDRAVLSCQVAPMSIAPLDDSEFEKKYRWDMYDGFTSPLSSLEGNSITKGEGECHQWPSLNDSDLGMALQGGVDLFLAKGPGIGFSPDSLGDTDVARAITLGLKACGYGIQVQL